MYNEETCIYLYQKYNKIIKDTLNREFDPEEQITLTFNELMTLLGEFEEEIGYQCYEEGCIETLAGEDL